MVLETKSVEKSGVSGVREKAESGEIVGCIRRQKFRFAYSTAS